MTDRVQAIKNSMQYRILSPDLKVLIELHDDLVKTKENTLYINEIARRLSGHLSKTTVHKSLIRLEDEGLVETLLGVVWIRGANHLVRWCRISNERIVKYVESVIEATYQSHQSTKPKL